MAGKVLNVTVGECEGAPLAGGWRKSDVVSILVDFAPQGINKGDIGTVVGPCGNAVLADKAERVLLDFGEGKGRLNVTVGECEGAALAGGWRKSDVVSILVDFAPQGISKGDIGTVVGPCGNADLADKAERVLLDFGEGKGRLNVTVGECEGAPLAGGWRKSDVVSILVDFAPQGTSKGDIGCGSGRAPTPTWRIKQSACFWISATAKGGSTRPSVSARAPHSLAAGGRATS